VIRFADAALWGLASAGPVVVAVRIGVRLRRSSRLHRRRANKAFMAGYRAAFRQLRPPVPPPVDLHNVPPIRPRTPADAGSAPETPAPAGPTDRGKHAR
jgi:hypothetical protein